MDLELAGKLAVVTGAARGIGLSVAKAFLAEGARVLIVDRDQAAGRVADDVGADVLLQDMLHRDAAAIVAMAAERMGGADILVNNAGISQPANVAAITDEDWQAVLGVNLDAAFRLTRALWPQLKGKNGAIVNVASFAAKRATLYAAPEDIADATVFLASRRARHVTGEVMNVNGGLVMD